MRTQSRVDAMVEDAYTLLLDGDVPSALMLARQCVRLDPNDADARGILGACLHAWKEPEQALEAFDKAIELDPRGARFYVGRGRIHFHANRVEQAVKDFSRANEIHPDDPEYLDALAFCAEQLGDLDAAARYLEDGVRLKPDSEQFRTSLAGLYLQQATASWTVIDNGERIPTTYVDITTARHALKKIELLRVTQPDVERVITELATAVKEAERRRFYATPKPGLMAIGLGLLLLAPLPIVGYVLLGGGLLYFVALRPPQYDLNRRALDPSGMSRFDQAMDRLYYQPDTVAHSVAMVSVRAGIAVKIATTVYKVLAVPVMAVWALLENYDIADYLTVEGKRLKSFVGERLMDDPLLERVRPKQTAPTA